jgi:pimeloyl-ACP methyl ester carboxylesterase
VRTSTDGVPWLPPGRIVEVPGRGELFARVTEGSDGRLPVLALHGWQATADLNFCALYPALLDRGFVAPDARSHGRGPLAERAFTLEDCADDAIALLDHLGIRRVVVIGYSMGGAVTQLVADRRPDLVAGIVVAASALRFASTAPKRLSIGIGGWHGALIRASPGRWGGHRLVDRAARSNPNVASLRSWIVAEMERGHPGGIRSAGRALAGFDGRSLAARGRERGLSAAVVLTTGDRLCPPRLQREAAAALNARIFEVPSDHDAPLAMGPAFVDAAVAALDHVSPSGATSRVLEQSTRRS